MKEIKIDCFLKGKNCEIISPITKFEINNPFEKEFALEVSNHSLDTCQLFLEAKVPSQNNSLLLQTNVFVIGEGMVIFDGSLENFFKQKIDLNSIEANNAKRYFFNFDFSSLYFKNEKIFITFDFVLDFNCADDQTEIKIANHEVLSASTSNFLQINDQSEVTKTYFWHEPFFYLLSSLCVAGFFVIMKIVHGKKKNKT